MTQPVRTLITNDDGIESEGLSALAAAAVECGLDVVVAAPLREASGSSASLIASTKEDGRIVVEERTLYALRGVPAYGVAATPAFITLIALHGAFGDPPQLVLAGINRGANVGRAVLHSGTVGAALTGAAYGCRAMAVSLNVGLEPVEAPNWEAAAEVACRLMPHVLATRDDLPAININVPDMPYDKIKGIRQCGLATFGIVQTNLAERGEDYVRVTIADGEAPQEPGTDAATLHEGYATVTFLQYVREVHGISLSVSL